MNMLEKPGILSDIDDEKKAILNLKSVLSANMSPFFEAKKSLLSSK